MPDDRIAQMEIIIFKVIEGNPLFLLLKRTPDRGGFWQPVTGGVKANEDFTLAAKREVQEETGVKDFVEFWENIHSFEFESIGYGHRKEYVYGAQVKENTQVILSSEHDEMKWVPLSEAMQLLKYETNKVGFRKIAEKLGKLK